MIRAALVAAALLLVAPGPPPAAAHEGEGTFTIEQAEPLDGLRVEYVVRLVYAADNHPAETSTVTAVAEGQGGQATTPVVLEPVGDGRYEGAVTFPAPGQWTVRFTAVTPAATEERVETLAPPPESTSTTAASTTAPTTAQEEAVGGDADGDDGDGDDGVPVVAIVGGAAAVALAVVVAVAARRWRRTPP